MHKQTTTESESNQLLLDSYVTYIHNNRCANCGQTETFAECFEVWLHPTKTRNSNLRDLRPVVGTQLKPLNMAHINAPGRMIPICHHCVGAYRVVGRPEIVNIKTDNGAWQETLRRKYEPPKAEPKVAAKPSAPAKAVPTLDQI